MYRYLSLCLLAVVATGAAPADESGWIRMQVPGTWEDNSQGELADYDGFAWYRCQVRVPAGWKGTQVEILLQAIDNAYEVFFDGTKIGSGGSLPPNYKNGVDERSKHVVPADRIRFGDLHWLAIRVYDAEGHGGFKDAVPVITNGAEATQMRGGWEFHTGDDLSWAKPDKPALPEGRPFEDLQKAESIVRWLTSNLKPGGPPSPEDSLSMFELPDDLGVDLLLSEPQIAQPLFLNFDERGRLWVVQYRQYPQPAGLKMLSRDKFWRAVYDKVPQAPPHHFPGKDRITIHEDTNGDGTFDKETVFLDGLNIATAVERGRGGVWVLNPPYLLFYPDANHDDVPDGDPAVHLAGFGLEDTHSVASSLCWGPDGWLYAAQGSTVSANIMRPGLDKDGVKSMGQLIWRYHPETKRYEIFAEGGGNTFGCEIDSKGRVYSGHNGGDTRGFHYVQGGYYQKGFSKHGPLSNPYSFGYFSQMAHPPVPRFTHTFLIYEANALPEAYRGLLMGVSPLQGVVVASRVIPFGSTFRSEDVVNPMQTSDGYFKPVDIKLGPDGNVYVADWCDFNVNHYRNHEGNIDPGSGRVYRLRAKEYKPAKPENLGALSSSELVNRLSDSNRWVRRTALRLLGDRRDAQLVPVLVEQLRKETGQPALEALWAIHLSGGWSEAVALAAMDHQDPYVRLWAVRFTGDERNATSRLAERMARLAAGDSHPEVRSQLACTAKRLPAGQAVPIVLALLQRDDDLEDPHIPLLVWWALESKVTHEPEAVLALFEDSSLWSRPMVERHIVERLMRRFATAGLREDLLYCARLLNTSPTKETTKRLIAGFEQAFAGRSLAELPDELVQALAAHGGDSMVLGLRQGRQDAAKKAIEALRDSSTKADAKIQIVQILGEVDQPSAVPVMLDILKAADNDKLRAAILTTLARYSAPEVGSAILALVSTFTGDLREIAFTTLASRPNWARQLVGAVASEHVAASDVSDSVVRRMLLHQDSELTREVKRLWGDVKEITSLGVQKAIERYRATLRESGGTPYAGYQVFQKNCAKCHLLFGEGGAVGPDLTSYKRDDLDNLLLAIVHPSAEIREGFETQLVYTADGRVLSGFIADQDKHVVVLKTAEGQSISIERDDIDEMRRGPKSVMPDGLLDPLTDQQIRDLFAYLRASQPLNQ